MLAVGGVSAAAVPAVRNTAKMTFSSPENYYAGVVRSSALESSEQTAKLYKEYCEKYSKGESEEGSLSLTLGDMLADEIGLPAGASFGVDYSITAKDGQGAADLVLKAGDSELADISGVAAADTLYLAFPFLSSEWLSASYEDLAKYMQDMMYGSYYGDSDQQMFTKLDNSILDGTLLTEERTDRIFSKYADIYLDHAKNVKLTKNKEFTSESGITVKYTEACVTFTEAEVYALVTDILTAAKDDSDLQAIWTAAGGTEEDYDKIIDTFTESMHAEGADFGTGTLDFDLYIGSDGKIKGCSVSVNTEDGELVSNASSITYIKGTKYAFEYKLSSVSEYSTDVYSYKSSDDANFVLNGALKGGKINGTGRFTISENSECNYSDDMRFEDSFSDNSYSNETKMSFDIDIKDLDKKALEEGKFVGTISVNGGNEDATVGITLSAGKDNIECTADISADGEKALTISITDKTGEYKEFTVPEGKTYSLLSEDDLIAYAKTIDVKKFKSNIENARASLGDEFTDELLEFADELEQAVKEEKEAASYNGENIDWNSHM